MSTLMQYDGSSLFGLDCKFQTHNLKSLTKWFKLKKNNKTLLRFLNYNKIKLNLSNYICTSCYYWHAQTSYLYITNCFSPILNKVTLQIFKSNASSRSTTDSKFQYPLPFNKENLSILYSQTSI